MDKPFLIIVEHALCEGTIASFSLGLGKALEKTGETVEYFTFTGQNIGELDRFVGRQFSAVFGVHTSLFNVRLPGRGPFIFDYIGGPKFHIMTDNPLGLPHLFTDVPGGLHALAVDDNYRSYFTRFFPNVESAHTFYPGCDGEICGRDFENRDIPLLFLGNFFDHRALLGELRRQSADARRLALRFLSYVNHNPDKDTTAALDHALAHFCISLSGSDYADLLIAHKDVERIVFYRYKELIIRYLLEEGVPVTVVGSSWESSPFRGSPLLTILPDVSYEESLSLYSRAKLSLNMMTTHRDAVTERVVTSMACGAAVASTTTTGLENAFTDDEILLFPYGDKATLRDGARRIKALLADEARLCSMAAAGRKKALASHTWDARARQFLDIINYGHWQTFD